MTKTAIVLFNLGGPNALDAVKPFLFNLFNDRAIIPAPKPIRYLIAKLISRRRAPIARAIYQQMGGSSTILPQTKAQARALERALTDLGAVKTFIAMRYWHPMSEETAFQVHAFAPDRIVLLPLYPQYSTTTVASSLTAWKKAARKVGLSQPSIALCCYPAEDGFIEALVALIKPALEGARAHGTPRLLLSAHGLPKKIVAAGDPYQWQIEETARHIVERLDRENLDWRVCYQSRVGPLEWIGPSTDDEIKRAGAEKRPVVIVPVAFVSEHSETLVELDIEYRKLAREHGVPHYARVGTVGTWDPFINALADLVRGALTHLPNSGTKICSARNGRLCPSVHRGCALERP